MVSVSPDASVEAQTYLAEYCEAVERTESLGLQAPPRVIVRKNCVDPDRLLAVLLDYFDRHTPEEMLGQTLNINLQLVELLDRKMGVPFLMTFGYVEMYGQRYGECSEYTVQRFLVDKVKAWTREGVPFHVWLTSLACEVVDITWAMSLGVVRTRDVCARRIIYKPLDSPHSSPPTYHPIVVGEDFLYQSGCVLELG
jgi:hypothetical protein